MGSAWRWTVFSVFIISSHSNVLVMCQNVVPNRPLPPAPILRETDCSGGPAGPSLQQMNGFNYNLQRSLERGPEINSQCLAGQRPPIFQDLRTVPEFFRVQNPFEPMNGRQCPLSVNAIQQSNLPQPCPVPSPMPTNTIQPPLNLPNIPNNISPYREKVLMNPPLPQNTPLPRLEQGCSASQPFTQNVLLQQGPGIPLPQNRIASTSLPPGIQGPTNLSFISNQPSCEQIPAPLLPQISINMAKVTYQEPIIPSNSIIPPPSPYTDVVNPNLDNTAISPQYPTAPRPFNLLPPPKLLSPVPNLLPMPMPFNSLRAFPFGPGSVPSCPSNTIQSSPVQNPPLCSLENQGGNQIALAKQDINCPLAASNIPINQQSNTVVQSPQQFPIINIPSVQGSCPQNFPLLSLPSVQTNLLNNFAQNQNLPMFPTIPNSCTLPFIPPPSFLPPCSLNTDLSSIQLIPQPASSQPNLINDIPIPINPLNIAAPIYQTTTLPPVLPVSNICDSLCQNPIIEESTAPAPINLQINIPPPIITPPKIIIIAPSPPTPPAVVEEEISSAVEAFPPYPIPPIIVEGRRSKSRNWLPLFLVALCSRSGCGGCGGNCCSGNSGGCSGNSGSSTFVPFPIPIPISQVINN